jgi:hypothetical protein
MFLFGDWLNYKWMYKHVSFWWLVELQMNVHTCFFLVIGWITNECTNMFLFGNWLKYKSECYKHTNGGCYTSQNIQTANVIPFVISITIYLRRISYQRFKLLKCWKLNLLFSFTIYNYTYVWLGNNKAYLWIKGKSKFLHIINESLEVQFIWNFLWQDKKILPLNTGDCLIEVTA